MSGTSRSLPRFNALATASARRPRKFDRIANADGRPKRTSDFFGCNTFSYDLLATKLNESEISTLRRFATQDQPLDRKLADKVAQAAKEWAMARGATHYCHWFQPQTGATAEKHDAFFSFDHDGSPIDQFTGKQLIQSEPDASSFPSGGRRSTFEARGYTAWDASSPMFLMETDSGVTLCIPSLFLSYSGEALDKKTPLLRSLNALSSACLESLKLLGERDVSYVIATAGPEQEYFVIDEALYTLRPDLVLAGRTLLGRSPPKGQQLEDHYFGSIKPRVLNFMMEFEHELYKLGVPCKTRHNEVAPSQCETAPIFEWANVAADHNQLCMEVIRSVARRHNFAALFHEKPFAGVNGSGKHVNWSMQDSKGRNLLEPGDQPHANVRFLFFLTAVTKAIHDHGALMRAAVATPGNDFRLGANEAPPAIISVYLGETLTAILERLASNSPQATASSQRQQTINLDLARVPAIDRDNTDRNRTSPFAFTGNKFEFRAVGASASVSQPLTFLNGAVAQALRELNDRLRAMTGGSAATDAQVLALVTDVYKESRRVCFEGNNYDPAWHAEAGTRGLPNLRTTPEALAVLAQEQVQTFLADLKIMSREECQARYNVMVERYIKIRMIELETLLEIAQTQVLPAALVQLNTLVEVAERTKHCTGSMGPAEEQALTALRTSLAALESGRKRVADLIAKVSQTHDEVEAARLIAEHGIAAMDQVRAAANELENLVDDALWSLPKYRELLYIA